VTSKVGVWKLAGDEINSGLESVADIPVCATRLLWDEIASECIFTLDDTHLRCWDVESPSSAKTLCALHGDTSSEAKATVGGLAVNPHFSTVVAVCADDSIVAFDLRETRKPCWTVPGADAERIRDVDFNPNRPYYLCAGGMCELLFV
jgi:WD40 repeat protein